MESLPHEILKQSLVNLDGEDIARCRAVSLEWNELLHSADLLKSWRAQKFHEQKARIYYRICSQNGDFLGYRCWSPLSGSITVSRVPVPENWRTIAGSDGLVVGVAKKNDRWNMYAGNPLHGTWNKVPPLHIPAEIMKRQIAQVDNEGRDYAPDGKLVPLADVVLGGASVRLYRLEYGYKVRVTLLHERTSLIHYRYFPWMANSNDLSRKAKRNIFPWSPELEAGLNNVSCDNTCDDADDSSLDVDDFVMEEENTSDEEEETSDEEDETSDEEVEDSSGEEEEDEGEEEADEGNEGENEVERGGEEEFEDHREQQKADDKGKSEAKKETLLKGRIKNQNANKKRASDNDSDEYWISRHMSAPVATLAFHSSKHPKHGQIGIGVLAKHICSEKYETFGFGLWQGKELESYEDGDFFHDDVDWTLVSYIKTKERFGAEVAEAFKKTKYGSFIGTHFGRLSAIWITDAKYKISGMVPIVVVDNETWEWKLAEEKIEEDQAVEDILVWVPEL